MTSKSTLPAKRARTSAATANSPKSPRDASEELTQVTNLIEKRRLQNRISQQNYRNKIRVRLEKLEALVDASGLDESKVVDKPRRRPSANMVARDTDQTNGSQCPQDTVKSEVTSQQYNIPNDHPGNWRPIPDLGIPRDGNFDNVNFGSQMDGLASSLGSHSMQQQSYSTSNLVKPVGADCVSVSPSITGASQPEDSTYGIGSSGSESGLTPGTPEIERIDPKFSLNESRFESGPFGQHGYADALSLNPMAQLNAPFLPLAPMTYPSCSDDGSGFNPWCVSSFGSSNALHHLEQQYVWIPFPVSVANMPSEAVKPQNKSNSSSSWKQ